MPTSVFKRNPGFARRSVNSEHPVNGKRMCTAVRMLTSEMVQPRSAAIKSVRV